MKFQTSDMIFFKTPWCFKVKNEQWLELCRLRVHGLRPLEPFRSPWFWDKQLRKGSVKQNELKDVKILQWIFFI